MKAKNEKFMEGFLRGFYHSFKALVGDVGNKAEELCVFNVCAQGFLVFGAHAGVVAVHDFFAHRNTLFEVFWLSKVGLYFKFAKWTFHMLHKPQNI